MENFTPEFFNTLIVIVMVVGAVLAAIRFYRDMTRPISPRVNDYEEYLRRLQDDTQPRRDANS